MFKEKKKRKEGHNNEALRRYVFFTRPSTRQTSKLFTGYSLETGIFSNPS